MADTTLEARWGQTLTKTAASPTDPREVPQEAVVSRIMGTSPADAFDGIHGYILVYQRPSRLPVDDLKKLVRVKGLRWVDGGRDHVSVGL